jgi:hypothetical protein
VTSCSFLRNEATHSLLPAASTASLGIRFDMQRDSVPSVQW